MHHPTTIVRHLPTSFWFLEIESRNDDLALVWINSPKVQTKKMGVTTGDSYAGTWHPHPSTRSDSAPILRTFSPLVAPFCPSVSSPFFTFSSLSCSPLSFLTPFLPMLAWLGWIGVTRTTNRQRSAIYPSYMEHRFFCLPA